jgi:porphobilinogen synthase
MVKPGLFYLDMIARLADSNFGVPIAAYQTSGEYSMLYYAAEKGVFDLKDILIENLTAYRRAGTNILLTYYTPILLDLLSID